MTDGRPDISPIESAQGQTNKSRQNKQARLPTVIRKPLSVNAYHRHSRLVSPVPVPSRIPVTVEIAIWPLLTGFRAVRHHLTLVTADLSYSPLSVLGSRAERV